MEKSSFKSRSKSLCIFPVVARLLLTTTVLLSAVSIQSVNGSVSWDWDNSTIGSTTVADDQEFLMDSQFGNVLAGPRRSTAYGVLQKKPICGAKIYGNCIVKLDANHRPCNFKNRCSRNTK